MQHTPILQFGTSRFLQAHADLFLSQAMEGGQEVGPITIVQSSGDPSRAKRLAGLVGSYPVRIEGLVDGQRLQETLLVKSVARTLSTASDWTEISRIFVEEVQIVLSNTGDAGFTPNVCDETTHYDQRMSYPAKLTHLLRLRFSSTAAPIQIMPMELIAENGAVLKQRVMELAQNDSLEFRNYLESDVLWVNSLVDRIVSQPLEPAGAVAEPYALWAIEDQPGLLLPCLHPSVQVVPSLVEIETLKLFVLNLGHTFLADRWRMAKGGDDVLVRHLLSDAVESEALTTILQVEVRPAFEAAGLAEQFDAYLNTTLERFANPFLDHRIMDIAQNHAQKVSRRIAPLMGWAKAQGDRNAKPILSEIIARNNGQI
ncbi:D-mannonate oxidoreductase [Granulosicoccus antarcticus]|uniref:mannitol dehydrogenase family protein n=1 Tax=Granulosicoccus antarcticus TaxID=437505 RepID=UPI000B5A4169|nr:D-mannonate oxidoreductase [Granulosicoccus antarcticus]